MATVPPPQLQEPCSLCVSGKIRKGVPVGPEIALWKNAVRRDGRGESPSTLNTRLQFYAAAFDGHAIFDFVAALFLELFRLPVDEFLEIAQARRSRAFPRSGAR